MLLDHAHDAYLVYRIMPMMIALLSDHVHAALACLSDHAHYDWLCEQITHTLLSCVNHINAHGDAVCCRSRP